MNNTTRLASVNITNSKRLIPLRLILMGALAYLSIPALLFLIGFCKVWISGLVGLGMVVSLTFAIIGKNDHCERASGDVAFSYSFIGVVFIVSLLWCIICGQGGLVVQKWDWNFRNACFRDLITHSWPVVYNDFNNALVYYVGHWLPSAAISRCVYVSCGDIEFAWALGNYLLLVWTALGVSISLLLYFALFTTRKYLSRILLCLLFFVFGGLDAAVEVGELCSNLIGDTPFSIIENWAVFVSMENKTSQLAWVFHQAVPAWVATLFVLHDRRMLNWLFVLAMLTVSAPLPCCGLLLMMIVVCFEKIADQRLDAVKALITPQNLIGVLFALVVGAYFLSNQTSGSFSLGKMDDAMVVLAFIIIEWGLYACLSWFFFRADQWYWPTVISLFVASVVRIGSRADFSMRASIPALLILQVLVAKIVVERKLMPNVRMFVAGVLIVGAGGAFVDVASTLQRTFVHRTDADFSDQIVSFDRDLTPDNIEPPVSWRDWRLYLTNFYVHNPDDYFFFRHMAADWRVVSQ